MGNVIIVRGVAAGGAGCGVVLSQSACFNGGCADFIHALMGTLARGGA
jgi:hypothetical protein